MSAAFLMNSSSENQLSSLDVCGEVCVRLRSLGPKQQHRHADVVLHSARGRTQKNVGEKAVPVRAHRDQVAPLLFDPLDDFTRWVAVGHLCFCWNACCLEF